MFIFCCVIYTCILIEDLDKTFNAEQKELYEKLRDCRNEYTSHAKAVIFEYAFKLGMQIAIETLSTKED